MRLISIFVFKFRCYFFLSLQDYQCIFVCEKAHTVRARVCTLVFTISGLAFAPGYVGTPEEYICVH